MPSYGGGERPRLARLLTVDDVAIYCPNARSASLALAEWTATVETFPDFTRSTHILQRVHEALEADKRALGPAASLNSERGVVSATFQVKAPSLGPAAELAVSYDALAAAGFDVNRPGWRLLVDIGPADAEASASS